MRRRWLAAAAGVLAVALAAGVARHGDARADAGDDELAALLAGLVTTSPPPIDYDSRMYVSDLIEMCQGHSDWIDDTHCGGLADWCGEPAEDPSIIPDFDD